MTYSDGHKAVRQHDVTVP